MSRDHSQSAAKAALIALALCTAACKNMQDEAERTGAQLSRLSQDAGADEALRAVKEQLNKTVAPVVEPVAQKANETTQNIEALQTAKAAGEDAIRTVHDYGVVVVNKTEHVFHQMPQTESDVVQIVDEYNRRFTAWLANQYRAVQQSGASLRNQSRTEKSYRTRLGSKR
ncbi:MAG: hypothetical protein U0136_11185 [Bdellovibrionota bacterium]